LSFVGARSAQIIGGRRFFGGDQLKGKYMAFPNKKASMPPPETDKKKKPAIAIAVGIGKPKMPPPGMAEDDEPDDAPDSSTAGPAGSPATPPTGGPDDSTPDPAKMEKAGVIRANHHCQQCENWDPGTGDCSILGPGFAPDDACLRYFEEASSDDTGEDDTDAGTGDDAMNGGGAGAPVGLNA
jgi:hypothetical protein